MVDGSGLHVTISTQVRLASTVRRVDFDSHEPRRLTDRRLKLDFDFCGKSSRAVIACSSGRSSGSGGGSSGGVGAASSSAIACARIPV